MQQHKIYLDYNATTPLKNEVRKAMSLYNSVPLNPSAQHSYGRFAKNIIDDTRQVIKKYLNADNVKVIFTASGTEANNIILKGFNREVLTSSIEHASVLNAVEDSKKVPVTKSGVIDLIALEQMLADIEGEFLLSAILVNNETGVIQPVKEIAKLVKKYNGKIHCDAAQAIGKIKVDMDDLAVDAITISAHKIGGPNGAAALIVKNDLELRPVVAGGGQEYGYRSGTQNVLAIAGMRAAIENIELAKFAKLARARGYLEEQLKSICPDVVIAGSSEERVANTSFIIMPNVDYQTQLIHFDMSGYCVSAGSACSSGKAKHSYVLEAMGYKLEDCKCAIRVSLGIDTKIEQIDGFIKSWQDLYFRLNNQEKSKAAIQGE